MANDCTSAWGALQIPTSLMARGRSIIWPRRPAVMGIVNINDDSFSGDGTLNIDEALSTARNMIEQGADIIDVGGESARPNRPAISEQDEIQRVRPFLERFEETWQGTQPADAIQIWPPWLSINTWRAEPARVLLASGGEILNDMGALPGSANAEACAACGAALLIMHSVGEPKVAHRHVTYEDVLESVLSFFGEKCILAHAAGVTEESLLLDPGLDFAKPLGANIELVAATRRLAELGRPVLLPVSRKRMVSEILGGRPASERDAGTAGLVVSGALRGAAIFRVHNVRMTWQTLQSVEAVMSSPRRGIGIGAGG